MNSSIRQFDFGYCSDKEKIFKSYCEYTFTRTQSMFVWTGLPDTIPVKWLEMYLQRNGNCCITKVGEDFYCFLGNAGGELDEYYQPTIFTVANPFLEFNKSLKIGEDCVYCKNDYNGYGLTPLISRYCGLMTENLLTVRVSDINMRMMNLLSASDDNTFQSTKQYLKDLENGKIGVISESAFFDGIKSQSAHVGNGDYMIQFIELQQYLKGSLYNELGINANFNMKREALSGEEVALNDDALMPLIDDMLKQRREICEQLKDVYGLEVSVDYGSTWHSNVIEKDIVSQELGATDVEANEVAGDESSLPDDIGANVDVSQLNENEATELEKEDEPVEDVEPVESEEQETEEQETEEQETEEQETEEQETEEQETEEQETDNKKAEESDDDEDK